MGYLVAATRGRDVLATPVRVHLGVLAGMFLLSTAFGYQLDKYELAYSANGVATGVSFTDANARFFAYDLLTVVSGLAAAFLVGGAFTRWLWPLGATMVVWFLASFFVGTLYPAAVQRFTVEPNKFAQEERFIGNNIAMVATGPMPGNTPISVPRKQPMKQYHRLVQLSATEKPRIRFLNRPGST